MRERKIPASVMKRREIDRQADADIEAARNKGEPRLSDSPTFQDLMGKDSLWHAYQPNFTISEPSAECRKKYKYREKPREIRTDNTFGLWPGLATQEQLENGEQLFGYVL
jgi:hypothetical protein